MTFLLGIIVGHWLSIHRDKRNRLFELSKKLKVFYVKQSISPNVCPEYKVERALELYLSYKSSIDSSIEIDEPDQFELKKKANQIIRILND